MIANPDGDILYKSVYNIDFASGSYTKPINFYMDPTSSFVDNETKKSWPNGEYQILPMMMKGQYDDYKNISELQPLESNGGMSSVKLTITDTEFTLTPDKEIPLPDLHFNKATSMSKLFIGSSDEIITFTIENKSPTTYSGEVIFYFVHEKYNETETDIMSQPYFSVNASIYGSREVDV